MLEKVNPSEAKSSESTSKPAQAHSNKEVGHTFDSMLIDDEDDEEIGGPDDDEDQVSHGSQNSSSG